MKKQKVLSNSEIAAFCRQTSMLLQAGITPADGMDILIQDTISHDGQKLLQNIADSCMKGDLFCKAVEATGVFPRYVVKLIALGEESGNLDSVLLSLAEYYEREESTSESIRSAVTYPFIMIAMMFLIIVVLIVKVLPVFQQVFKQLGTEMTPLAVSLMNAGSVLSKYAIVITVLLLAIAVICIILYKLPAGRNSIRQFLTTFALTRNFYERMAAGRFAGGMYLAFTSGMDTYHSLEMIEEIVENDQMVQKIEICKKEMEEHSDLPEALAKADIFSNFYSRMISVGFRSGSVDSVMKRIAVSYEEETDKQLARIISIIEPTLVIILSVVVGIILLSVLLPLMGVMSSIG